MGRNTGGNPGDVRSERSLGFRKPRRRAPLECPLGQGWSRLRHDGSRRRSRCASGGRRGKRIRQERRSRASGSDVRLRGAEAASRRTHPERDGRRHRPDRRRPCRTRMPKKARARAARSSGSQLRPHQRLRRSRSGRRISRSWRSTRASSSPRTRRSGRRSSSRPSSDAASDVIAALDVRDRCDNCWTERQVGDDRDRRLGHRRLTRRLRRTRQGAGQLRHLGVPERGRRRSRPRHVRRGHRGGLGAGLRRCCAECGHRLARRHGRQRRRQDERRDRGGRVDLPEQGGVQHPRRQLLAPLGVP